jgi:hypothetical protein
LCQFESFFDPSQSLSEDRLDKIIEISEND